MVELVADVRHLDAVDHLTVRLGVGVDIDDREEVRRVDVRPHVETHHVRELFRRRLLDGRLWRRVPRPRVVAALVPVLGSALAARAVRIGALFGVAHGNPCRHCHVKRE